MAACIRDKLIELMGGLPATEYELQPELLETREFEGYIRETVSFQSRPQIEVYRYFLSPTHIGHLPAKHHNFVFGWTRTWGRRHRRISEDSTMLEEIWWISERFCFTMFSIFEAGHSFYGIGAFEFLKKIL